MEPSPQELKSELQGSKKYETSLGVLRKAYNILDEVQRKCISDLQIKLDCKSGCSYCCYFRVDAQPHEILLISEFLKKKLSEEDLEFLKNDLREYRTQISSLEYEQHQATNIKCPLLKENICSVYEVRPFGCRRHHAQDVSGCIYSYENPTDLDYPGTRSQELTHATLKVETTIGGMFKSEKYDSGVYEMCTALLESLESPKAVKRWKSKKRVYLDSPKTNFD